MRVVLMPEQMYALEVRHFAATGSPSIQLMERAADEFVRELVFRLGPLAGRRVKRGALEHHARPQRAPDSFHRHHKRLSNVAPPLTTLSCYHVISRKRPLPAVWRPYMIIHYHVRGQTRGPQGDCTKSHRAMRISVR